MKSKRKLKDYTFVYPAKWTIKGFEHYGILADKRIFNYNTNRFCKRQVNKYSTYLNLDGKPYNLDKLKEDNKIILVKNTSFSLCN